MDYDIFLNYWEVWKY